MAGSSVRSRAGVAGAILRTKSTIEEEKQIERRALELLDYVGIRARANDAAGSLPYGVAIACGGIAATVLGA